jgi:hypothetical protein
MKFQEPEKEQAFASVLCNIKSVFDYEENAKWFFSFGTLLYFIRDMNMGKEYWGDIDVSVLDAKTEAGEFERRMKEFGFRLKHKAVDSEDGRPYQMAFNDEFRPGLPDVDVFFWRKGVKNYYHAYDYHMDRPKSGVLSRYVFKGTPVAALKGEPYKYVWLDIAPDMNFPHLYGTLLDIWYPGWFIPDRNFGQSNCVQKVEVKNCKGLKEKLI